MRTRLQLLISILLAAGIFTAPVSAAAGPFYFPPTGHYVAGAFADWFQSHGGARIVGLPRTEQYVESGRVVQYFQRARMEWWPGSDRPVRLALLGDIVLGPGSGEAPAIAPEFRELYEAWGGEALFGSTTSEPHDLGGLLVQNFQRFRMEWWPDDIAGQRVKLSLLGDDYVFGSGAVPETQVAAAPAPVDLTSPVASSTAPASGAVLLSTSVGGDIYAIDPTGANLQLLGTGVEPSWAPALGTRAGRLHLCRLGGRAGGDLSGTARRLAATAPGAG